MITCNCKPGIHRTFHQAYDCLSCAVRENDLSQRTIHRFYRLQRDPGKHGHFQFDTAAGRSRKLAVAVLTGGVVFPNVTSLPLKFQMVLYVIHKLDIFLELASS